MSKTPKEDAPVKLSKKTLGEIDSVRTEVETLHNRLTRLVKVLDKEDPALAFILNEHAHYVAHITQDLNLFLNDF